MNSTTVCEYRTHRVAHAFRVAQRFTAAIQRPYNPPALAPRCPPDVEQVRVPHPSLLHLTDRDFQLELPLRIGIVHATHHHGLAHLG
jgi:hypothetical protein